MYPAQVERDNQKSKANQGYSKMFASKQNRSCEYFIFKSVINMLILVKVSLKFLYLIIVFFLKAGILCDHPTVAKNVSLT